MNQVIGSGRTVHDTITRPADTTQYAAGDVVGGTATPAAILAFARAIKEKLGFSVLQQAILISSANQATKLDADLLLFNAAVVMDNDNAAFTPTDAEMLTFIGRVNFPSTGWVAGDATAGSGGNAVCDVQNIGMPINSTTAENGIFGVLVARNSYTPISAEVFTVRCKFID